jgi:hypothetical protein
MSLEDCDSRESFGLALAWDDPTCRNQAHSGMELRHVLSDGGAAALSDQLSLVMQAARAMLDCQQLQWECLQAN